jgi:hypothetical protein
MAYTNPQDAAAYQRKWYLEHKEEHKAASAKWYQDNKEEMQRKHRDYHRTPRAKVLNMLKGLEVKTEVLAHYSLKSSLNCSVENCVISDIDMLTLDHINNNGSSHRKELNGSRIYECLKRKGYPEGYQTLCHNHNWKKELQRRRLPILSALENDTKNKALVAVKELKAEIEVLKARK